MHWTWSSTKNVWVVSLLTTPAYAIPVHYILLCKSNCGKLVFDLGCTGTCTCMSTHTLLHNSTTKEFLTWVPSIGNLSYELGWVTCNERKVKKVWDWHYCTHRVRREDSFLLLPSFSKKSVRASRATAASVKRLHWPNEAEVLVNRRKENFGVCFPLAQKDFRLVAIDLWHLI